MKIKRIVESDDTRAGKIFNFAIQALIVFSLVTFSIETLPDLSARTRQILATAETIVVLLFTGEYLLRLAVADRKIGFIFSFFGLIDLLAILPFYLAGGVDLRSLRIFRLFRLLRAFKLFRYSRSMQRFKEAFLLVKGELILFAVATCFLLFVAAVGIYYFENPAQPDKFKSIFHCLWWAVATLTTIGYGDIYPITAGGRIFTSIVVMIGIGFIAVPTGLLASALTATVKKKNKN